MSKVEAVVSLGVMLALASGAAAQTQHSNVLGGQASAFYSRDDRQEGGLQVQLNVTASSPVYPAGRSHLTYSGYSCVIAGCYEWWPGNLYCYCDYSTFKGFGGQGTFPSEAFSVSPQGSATLDLDAALIAPDPWGMGSYGECNRFRLTFRPDGALHTSANGVFVWETPTDLERAVQQQDSWSAKADGEVCGLPASAAGGNVIRNHVNGVTRTPKP
jgi:hypothetical protein